MNNYVVLGGWGVGPDILKPLFGDDSLFLDINKVMPDLINNETPVENWSEIAAAKIRELAGEGSIRLAGWSTGAMIAWGAGFHINPAELILLSPTPCFCRKDDFKPGVRPKLLDSMISSVQRDKDSTLGNFHKRCGLTTGAIDYTGYSTHQLLCGLQFLKHIDLRPLTPLCTTPVLMHGRDDLIIPAEAAAMFADKIGGDLELFDGPHAFFNSKERHISQIIANKGS
ncbi:alpha/beta hydrolase [Chitinispirillales bacterium ANBcel5]|uniref:alpha/beta hydrolase n=1 Tax=Cellulosispirillum alkaliphilum TaxID=3039283 RepID=UPI002A54CB5D|nr:alpha/beta hydrolase [Chitinispirillales bacterium ANBcel5]